MDRTTTSLLVPMIHCMLRYRLGTMGYTYADWRGPFYPAGVGQGKWLTFYASQFDSLELNTTFHAVPGPEQFRRWASRVGGDFRFAVKTPRAITHDRPLKLAVTTMLEFVETIRALGISLGPVLIQLPPACTADVFGDLERLLEPLPKDLRFAVEFRHPSWVTDQTTSMLHSQNTAWVGLDHLDHPHLRRMRATSDFLYVRLVGRHGRFSRLNEEQIDVTADLKKWHAAILREVDRSAGRIKEVWVLANNDFGGHAPATLRRFAKIAGITLSPAPAQSELFS